MIAQWSARTLDSISSNNQLSLFSPWPHDIKHVFSTTLLSLLALASFPDSCMGPWEWGYARTKLMDPCHTAWNAWVVQNVHAHSFILLMHRQELPAQTWPTVPTLHGQQRTKHKRFTVFHVSDQVMLHGSWSIFSFLILVPQDQHLIWMGESTSL